MNVRRPTRIASALVVILIVGVMTGCADGTTGGGSAAGPTARGSAQQAVGRLIGSQWTLTDIEKGGTSRSVPEALHATWQFTGDQQFLASDTVNAISGRYRLLPTGFATIDAASTAVGYVGSDPVRLAVMSGFQTMTTTTVVVTASSPTTVIMRVPDYVMTFSRSGPAHTFPPASPTPAASSH